MRNRIRETFADVLTVMEKENEEKRASASLRPPGWSAFQVQKGAAKKAKMTLKRLELRKLKNKTDAAMKEGLIEEQVLREEEEEELQEAVDEVSGVNRVVETKEVRQELGLWIEAITGEVNSLVEKGAIERYRGVAAREFLREHPGACSYPAKPVFVAKKSGKKKCRIVICGNFISNDGNENTYSSTPDATGVRMVLRLGALLDDEDLKTQDRRA